jgi:undecaprenyl-diphosphatase
VLLGPALVLGALFGMAVRRHPGIDPASAHPASATAHQIEEHTRLRRLLGHLDPRTETGLLLTLGLIVLVVGGVVLAVLALLVRSHSTVLEIDRSVAPWGEQHLTSFASTMLDFVTSFGTTGVIVGFTVGVFAVEMVRRPSRWLPVFLLAVTVGQTVMSTQVKDLVDRIRPTVNPIAHTLGPSFPSGHTTGAAACFAAFALVLGRGRSRGTQALLAGSAVFVACAVAASRVLLGVHWLTDVLGGLALGWAWFALCSVAFGGRLLRLGAPVEAAERAGEFGAQRSRSERPDPVPRA